MACDIRPGRRPLRPALRELVLAYRKRAGITGQTGPGHELAKRGMCAPPAAKEAGEQGKERL